MWKGTRRKFLRDATLLGVSLAAASSFLTACGGEEEREETPISDLLTHTEEYLGKKVRVPGYPEFIDEDVTMVAKPVTGIGIPTSGRMDEYRTEVWELSAAPQKEPSIFFTVDTTGIGSVAPSNNFTGRVIVEGKLKYGAPIDGFEKRHFIEATDVEP